MSDRPSGARRPGGKPDGRTAESFRLLKTAEVIKKAEITHQVLYRYFTCGLIEPAVTTATGVRLFHPVVVPLIDIIKGLNASGYSLRDMKDIFFKDERVQRLLRAAAPADGKGKSGRKAAGDS